MSLLDGLGRYLAERGHGVWRTVGAYSSDEIAITLEQIPTSPGRVVCLTSYEGQTTQSGQSVDEPRVQIRVRGTSDPAWSREHVAAIRNELHGLTRTTLPDGTYVVTAHALGSPGYLGQDKNDRHSHVVNVQVSVHNPERIG